MKKTMLRRGLAWLLVLVMALSAVPFGVFAEEAPQGEGTSQAENGNPDQTPVCTCAEQAKCTGQTSNTACPVCSAEGADLDTCCQGKTQEQLDAEAATKKATEEEAAKKAAEKEAAKKAAEEEAAQKAAEEAAKKAAEEAARRASDEAVESVQAQIDALPAADTVTAENREAVEKALTAIDNAKEKLTDEERGKLDFAKYDAAVKALSALSETPEAEVPKTLEETDSETTFPTPDELLTCLEIVGQVNKWISDPKISLVETYPGSKILTAVMDIGDADASDDYARSFKIRKENTAWDMFWGAGDEGALVPKVGDALLVPGNLTGSVRVLVDIHNYNRADGTGMTLRFESADPPYTITFDTQDDTQNTTAETGSDGKLTRLPEPTKEGYVFRGWKDGDGNIVSESTVFDKDTTLTALWTPVQTHDCIMELEPLTKEQFDLWMNGRGYNALDAVEVYGRPRAPKPEQETKAEEVLGTENVRLIGFDIGVTLKIGETIPVTDTQKTIRLIMPMKCVDFGDKLTILRTHDGKITEIPKGKPQGDTEEGWYLDGEGKIHLAVRYFSDYAVACVPYTVSFDSKGGSSCQPVTTLIDGTLEVLPTPTRTGYTFDGWYVKKEDGTEAKVEKRATVFTADTTVYAKWSPVTYTVTFHANYGDTDTTATQTFTYDAPQALNCGTGIAREYYRISGWAESAQGAKKYEANETVKNLGTVTEDGFRGKDLYALWEYVSVSVTFDARGVDGDGNVTQGTVTENGQKKDTVERKTQETPINTLRSLPVPDAQQDYEFVGWYYKDKDDRNKEKPVLIGSTVFTEPTTVYAKWKSFEPVTVTLKCQKGTMTLGGKTVSEGTMQTKWPGVLDGTLPTPARTGYKFQGWYTAAGLKADEDTVFLKDTTLYARWISAVSRSGNPKTGDQVRLGLALGILAVAAVGLTAAIAARKRKK